MANENENSQADLDALFMTDDSQSDVFGTAESDVSGADPFSTDASTDVFGNADADPFGNLDSSFGAPTEGAVESPFANIESAAPAETPASDAGKGKKKGKKEKPAKVKPEKGSKAAKAPKAPKEPKVKAPKGDYQSSPTPFYVLAAVVAFFLVVESIVKLISGVSPTTIAIFDVVGLILLIVPFMLLSQLRKTTISVWSMYGAVTLMTIVLGSMALLLF